MAGEISTTEQIVEITTTENAVAVSVTESPVAVTVSDIGLQGPSGVVNATSPITYNSTTKTVAINDATTAQKGAVQLEDSVSSTSTTTGATPNSVKTVYDIATNSATAQQVHVYVKNGSGSVMTKGQVVYINSAVGANPLIALAQANSEATSSKTLGVLEQDLAVNAFGYVATEGILTGINTGSASDGDPIWLSGTTAGGMVFGIANKPSAPTHMVFVGYVLRAQQNNGVIYVKPQNGFELEELHNVQISSLADGQTISYDSANSVWKNTNFPVTGVTSITASSPLTGGTITSTGTIGLGTVPVSNGGTGQTAIPVATTWVSGTTYAVGDLVLYQTGYYVRRVAGAGTTAPSADSTNWAPRSMAGNLQGALGQTASSLVAYNASGGVSVQGMVIGTPPASIPSSGLNVSNGSINVSGSGSITSSGTGNITQSGSGQVLVNSSSTGSNAPLVIQPTGTITYSVSFLNNNTPFSYVQVTNGITTGLFVNQWVTLSGMTAGNGTYQIGTLGGSTIGLLTGGNNVSGVNGTVTAITVSGNLTEWKQGSSSATSPVAYVQKDGGIVANSLNVGQITSNQTITTTSSVTASQFYGSGVGLTAGTVLASALVGTDITTVGTITTGAWNAGVIPVLYGGTGVTTSTGTGSTVRSASPSFTGTPVMPNIRLSNGTPSVQAGTTYTITLTNINVVLTSATGCTVTLPTALAGVEIRILNVGGGAINSASSNVYPKNSRTLGNAILPATAGSSALLVTDGTNWTVML